MYVLPTATQGYEAGTELRDVTLKQARAMECNRCGGCCNGTLPDDVVRKDDVTGLPMFTWGEKYPDDLYESRYGVRMLEPVGFLDNSDEMPYQGRIGVVQDFERDSDGKAHTCFKCTFHSMVDGLALCALREAHDDGNPKDLSTVRPLNCGEFPVFSSAIDDSLVNGVPFVPATGHLPQCTWHGIRITGPYRDTSYWKDRWDRQQRGIPQADLSLPRDFIEGLEWKAKQNNGR